MPVETSARLPFPFELEESGRSRSGLNLFREGDQRMLDSVFKEVFAVIVGVLVGFFVRDPLKGALARWQQSRERSRKRIDVDVMGLEVDELLPNLSGVVTGENHRQSTFEFAYVEAQLAPTKKEARILEDAPGKKEFVETVAAIAARAGKDEFSTDEGAPSGDRDLPRAVVVTAYPLPGNFYAWNTRNRRLLVISTASVEEIIEEEDGIELADFVVRILQRMVIFSTVPTLDPLRTHTEQTRGCLFDFTIFLAGVVDLIRQPGICPRCHRAIAEAQGDRFALAVDAWVRGGAEAAGASQ